MGNVNDLVEYEVKWSVTGHDKIITTNVLLEKGYSTTRDIPKMLSLRFGFDVDRIVIRAKARKR